MIVSDPSIRGGEPVIAGTRIPAETIASLYRTHTVDEILAIYPDIKAADVKEAIFYAEDHALLSRPPKVRATAVKITKG